MLEAELFGFLPPLGRLCPRKFWEDHDAEVHEPTLGPNGPHRADELGGTNWADDLGGRFGRTNWAGELGGRRP